MPRLSEAKAKKYLKSLLEKTIIGSGIDKEISKNAIDQIYASAIRKSDYDKDELSSQNVLKECFKKHFNTLN